MVIAVNAERMPILADNEKSLDRIICKYIITHPHINRVVFKKVTEHEASHSLVDND